MVDTLNYYKNLKAAGIDFFTGVPDSLLKNFCSCIQDRETKAHISAANEGNSIGLATGYYLATGKVPLVYMQNSGVGNSVNPLVSLTSDTVYSIPVVLMIGWRGQPGEKDEPQHVNQGRITTTLLDTLGVEWEILSQKDDEAVKQTNRLHKLALEEKKPKALIVQKGTFSEYSITHGTERKNPSREDVLETLIENIGKDSYVFTTTGKTSRELFELREKKSMPHERDFLTVGSMGHTSSIALAFSKYNECEVFCIDGDGALLMHMGSLPVNASESGSNFKYILLNNYSHESVGGQPTASHVINFEQMFQSVGFPYSKTVYSLEEFIKVIKSKDFHENSFALEVVIRTGSRADLGRPTIGPKQAKEKFMETI